MVKKIIISCVVVIAFVAILFVGAKNYHEKIEKDNIIIAREKVKAANKNHELSLLNEARKLLESVDGKEKEELLQAIKEIEFDIAKERIYNSFMNRINKLSEDYSVDEASALRKEIEKIEYNDIKLGLLDKLNNIGNNSVSTEENAENEEETLEKEEKKEEVLETLTGNISAYSAKKGVLASGKTVTNNNVLYKDNTYGEVYIVAGDESYPYGTIVKIKDLDYFQKDIYAIVLDRGEAIGKDKNALFDILFENDNNARGFGLKKNVTCEIIRIGF